MRRRDRHGAYDGPNAIDPRTGFKVKLSDLVKDGQTGDMIWKRVADRKHPQDMVRGVPDSPAPPFTRPEPAEEWIAFGMVWEDGFTPIMGETGISTLWEGTVPSL